MTAAQDGIYQVVDTLQEAAALMPDLVCGGDVILTMGAGDVADLGPLILQSLSLD